MTDELNNAKRPHPKRPCRGSEATPTVQAHSQRTTSLVYSLEFDGRPTAIPAAVVLEECAVGSVEPTPQDRQLHTDSICGGGKARGLNPPPPHGGTVLMRVRKTASKRG